MNEKRLYEVTRILLNRAGCIDRDVKPRKALTADEMYCPACGRTVTGEQLMAYGGRR